MRTPTGAAVARTVRWPLAWSCSPPSAQTGAAHRALWPHRCEQGRCQARLATLLGAAYPCTPPRRLRQGSSRRHAPLHARHPELHPAARWLPVGLGQRPPPGEAPTGRRHGQRLAPAGARRCARVGARCVRRAPGATARLPAWSAAAALAFHGFGEPAGAALHSMHVSFLPSFNHIHSHPEPSMLQS